MTHIPDSRWAELRDSDLTPQEAEHLPLCTRCERRWAEQTTTQWLDEVSALEEPSAPVAPPALLPATLARFDHARARSRSQKQAIWIACAAIHMLAGLAWLLMDGSATWLLARLSVMIASTFTVLGVVARIAAHFPLVATLHLGSVALCAVLLGWLWALTLRGRMVE